MHWIIQSDGLAGLCVPLQSLLHDAFMAQASTAYAYNASMRLCLFSARNGALGCATAPSVARRVKSYEQLKPKPTESGLAASRPVVMT